MATYATLEWAPVSAEIDALQEAASSAAAAAADADADADSPAASLSGEGRVLLTDHGAFVLINVYVPNAGGGPGKDRPRLGYKMRFLRALCACCRTLAAAGREVLLVGDFNVCCDERDVHPRIGLDNAYTPKERAACSKDDPSGKRPRRPEGVKTTKAS